MGFTDREIGRLCVYTQGKGISRRNWGVHPLVEMIFLIEQNSFNGKAWDEYSSTNEAKAAFVKLWEEKYSKCYCDFGPGLRTTLDAVSLYHQEQSWVFQLYNPDYGWGANVNKIRWISFQREIKGTILDYVDFLQNESGAYKVDDRPEFGIDVLNGYRDKLLAIGAKRMSEMTEEEIERNSQ